MARYRLPPKPHKDDGQVDAGPISRPEGDAEPKPLIWLGLGILVTLVSVVIAGLLIAAFLFKPPLAVGLATPTIIRLTAPPGINQSPTSILPTPSPIPTFTPPPTPDLSVAPDTITVGYFAQVTNTGNVGVSLRGGPSTDNIRLELVPEGDYLFVLDGPQEGSGYIWWQVRVSDGNEGWVAGDFLVPAAEPEEGFNAE